MFEGRFDEGNNLVNGSNATQGKTIINPGYKNTLARLTSGFRHRLAGEDCVYHKVRTHRLRGL